MGYVEVAVDAPVGVDRTFSYHVPSSVTVTPGQAVAVPFGPRTMAGLVFEVTDRPQVEQTRDILEVLYPEPLLYPHQLALTRWLSRTYLAPLFEAAALMLPPGLLGRGVGVVAAGPRSREADVQGLTAAQRRVLGYLESRGWVPQATLRGALGPTAEAALAAMERRGVVLREWRWRRPSLGGRSAAYLRCDPQVGGHTVASLRESRAPRQAALVEELLSASAPLLAGEARRRFGPGVVAALLRKGLARLEGAPCLGDPVAEEAPAAEVAPLLTEDQRRALSQVVDALDSPRRTPRSFLLFGVTGSGKTEVYLRALAHATTLGRRGVVLVPEIALTPQTVERFNRRFPGRVVVLHSRLTPRQRREAWWRLRRGDADVVIGSRSALFAPVGNLGLIVLDEEHEWSYKQQDAAPRYHAREAALELSRLTGAVVVLGSATPEVVTYHRAMQGQHGLLELAQRISPRGMVGEAGPMAQVEVVDMRRELRAGNRAIFSRALQGAVRGAMAEGGQVILFLNRRGSATHVQCRDCGHTLRCRRCETSLTYHGARGRLLCHHCGYSVPLPSACPACGGRRIRYLGVGTQRVVQEVQEAFPGVEVVRWDRDVATTAAMHDRLLRRFLQGEAQVLVGTQMIAKGLHIPNVMVVGVVLADLGLHIPDFRAPERVFQLLCQVAGRAGRGLRGGRAVIQTYQPRNYAVQAAASQDYRAFYAQEVAFRRRHRYPPFSRLAHLVYTHPNLARCQQEAERLARALHRHRRAMGDVQVEVVGPAPAFPARVRGRYRWHLVLRAPAPAEFLQAVAVPSGWLVDIDPVTVA